MQDVTGEVLELGEARKRACCWMREVATTALRNALTVVQSMVRLTTAGSMDDFREVLDGRVAGPGAGADVAGGAAVGGARGCPDVVEAEELAYRWPTPASTA